MPFKLHPKIAAQLKQAGLTMDDFRKMTPGEALKAGIGKGVDWREGDMGDTHIPSHPEMPDVTVGFHNKPVAPAADEQSTLEQSTK